MVLALVLVAIILLILAALNVPSGGYVNLGWLGLAFWALSTVIGRI